MSSNQVVACLPSEPLVAQTAPLHRRRSQCVTSDMRGARDEIRCRFHGAVAGKPDSVRGTSQPVFQLAENLPQS